MQRLGKLFSALLCIALLFCSDADAQQRHLRTYTLQHALAEQVAPALTPQLSPGSSVTPYRQQLILNVTDDEYQRLRPLLEQLDTAPRSLLISVRKQGQVRGDRERYGVQGRIGDGAVQIQSGDGRQQRTQIVIDRDSTQSTQNGTQQVRAVEGMAAFISSGSTVALHGSDDGHEYVPVASGFYATARVIGDEVIVDIDQRDDRMQGHDIATQGLRTQVRGNLGAWIPLGNLDDAQADSRHTVTNYDQTSRQADAGIAIKVDLAR